jgi:hypothetical protein
MTALQKRPSTAKEAPMTTAVLNPQPVRSRRPATLALVGGAIAIAFAAVAAITALSDDSASDAPAPVPAAVESPRPVEHAPNAGP